MDFQSPRPSARSSRRGDGDDDAAPSSLPPRPPVNPITNNTTIAMDTAPKASLRVLNESDGDDDDKIYDLEDDQPPEPLKEDHTSRSKKSGRHIFVTLYIIVFLALVGLAFASARYIQARKASNNSKIISPSEQGDVNFNRDTTAFKNQLQAMLSNVVESSALLQASSPQSQAIKWLVFEDRMLTMDDLTVGTNGSGGDPFQVYQRYALMALFFATSGELWEAVPWTDNTLVHACDFGGVDCDDNKQVVVLDLYLRKLRGRIPDDVGLLTQLTTLNLNSNLLEGSIPSFFFDKLTNLESLDLSRNEFSATLSPSISNLNNLKYLLLDQVGGLEGTLPESLKTLSDLRMVRLEQSQMRAPIFEFVSHWPQLEALDISQSLFTGTIPHTISDLENLSFLKMINSRVDATNLPSEIGLLSNLAEFQVWSTTGDGGTIPTELGSCKNLENLAIQGSNFVGEIPSELGQLSKLNRLVIEGGSIAGSVPSELGLLTNLKWLSLALNDIEGQLPEELGNLTKLSKLEVHYTHLTGSIPSGVCSDIIDISRSCPIIECDCCRNPCHKN